MRRMILAIVATVAATTSVRADADDHRHRHHTHHHHHPYHRPPVVVPKKLDRDADAKKPPAKDKDDGKPANKKEAKDD